MSGNNNGVISSSSVTESFRQQPHAVVVPYPLQGHISPMMQLSKLLSTRGFLVTFITTNFNIQLMQRANPDLIKNLSESSIHLVGIADGLPDDDPRNPFTPEMADDIDTGAIPANTAKLVASLAARSDPPITCLVHDAFLEWAHELASEHCIPRVVFWPNSITCFLCTYSLDKIRAAVPTLDPMKGEVYRNPEASHGNLVLEGVIPGISSMPACNLPFSTLVDFAIDWMREHVRKQIATLHAADYVICNSSPDLEGVDTSMKACLPSNFFAVGPLFAAAATMPETTDGVGSTEISLWEEDEECVKWLDTQEEASVVYISLGSVPLVEEDELREIGRGAAASGQAFLWVVKTWASVKAAEDLIPEQVKDKVKEGRAKVVKWAPQLKVLGHKAVGAFVSHCGWNSTLEGLSMGVPMLCLPLMMDQLTNCWMACDKLKRGIAISRHVAPEDLAFRLETGIRSLMPEGYSTRKMEPRGSSSLGFLSFVETIVALR